jgi:hypothetical protein
MPAVSIRDLPKRDADAYRDAVIADEPVRLAELSDWVQRTGGPWDELDASVDSLRSLWPWFLNFLHTGTPGIPLGARARGHLLGPAEAPSADDAIAYAIEAVEHYVMLVCRRIDPSAAWTVDRSRKSMYFQCTGIRFGNKVWFVPGVIVGNMVENALAAQKADPKTPVDPDHMWTVLGGWLGYRALPPQEREASVLPPPRATPDPPPVLWSPSSMGPVELSPNPAEVRSPPAPAIVGPRGSSGNVPPDLLGDADELVILRGPVRGLRDPGRLEPLDGGLIANHLQANGFASVGGEQGGSGRSQLWELDGDLIHVSVSTAMVDGAVRYVEIAFEGDLEPSAPGFRSAAAIFVALADLLGAQLASSQDFDEDFD